jgi:hypothetical protein
MRGGTRGCEAIGHPGPAFRTRPPADRRPAGLAGAFLVAPTAAAVSAQMLETPGCESSGGYGAGGAGHARSVHANGTRTTAAHARGHPSGAASARRAPIGYARSPRRRAPIVKIATGVFSCPESSTTPLVQCHCCWCGIGARRSSACVSSTAESAAREGMDELSDAISLAPGSGDGRGRHGVRPTAEPAERPRPPGGAPEATRGSFKKSNHFFTLRTWSMTGPAADGVNIRADRTLPDIDEVD